MTKPPLFPSDGMQYDLAMMRAQTEYDAWLNDRKTNKGISVYSRKPASKSKTDAEL
jgi:hypothetical protein